MVSLLISIRSLRVLQDKDELEAAGGADYIVRLADSAISSANARHYIETIKNKAQLRALIYAADKIARKDMNLLKT